MAGSRAVVDPYAGCSPSCPGRCWLGTRQHPRDPGGQWDYEDEGESLGRLLDGAEPGPRLVTSRVVDLSSYRNRPRIDSRPKGRQI